MASSGSSRFQSFLLRPFQHLPEEVKEVEEDPRPASPPAEEVGEEGCIVGSCEEEPRRTGSPLPKTVKEELEGTTSRPGSAQSRLSRSYSTAGFESVTSSRSSTPPLATAVGTSERRPVSPLPLLAAPYSDSNDQKNANGGTHRSTSDGMGFHTRIQAEKRAKQKANSPRPAAPVTPRRQGAAHHPSAKPPSTRK
jgi:hypothetical protein